MSTKNKIYTKWEMYQRLMDMDGQIIDGSDFFKQAAEMIYHPKNPKVICLCGSMRFYEEFQNLEYELELNGVIVLSPGFSPNVKSHEHGGCVDITPEQKEQCDELHRRKIDLCDEVLVVNVGGYIGESTKGEIAYAILSQKPVKYLVQPK